MPSDVYTTAVRWLSCTSDSPTNQLHGKSRLFPPAGPLDCVTVNELGPLPSTDGQYIYIFVIMNRYSLLAKTILIAKTTVAKTAIIFTEQCATNLGIPSIVLTDTGPQLSSKCFIALCKALIAKAVTATEYLLPANRQVDRFNTTKISRITYYVADHQTDRTH